MEPSYAPRTVAIVALASLVLGFVAVFGGGMLLLRPQAHDRRGARDEARPGRARAVGGFLGDGSAPGPAVPMAVDAGSGGSADAGAPAGETGSAGDDAAARAAPAEPVSAAGITISPESTSRCFDRGPPTPILGSHCDHLAGLDQFVASKAAPIAACARAGSHGHLALVLDFRFRPASCADGAHRRATSRIPESSRRA